jgi:hypothetical protein
MYIIVHYVHEDKMYAVYFYLLSHVVVSVDDVSILCYISISHVS